MSTNGGLRVLFQKVLWRPKLHIQADGKDVNILRGLPQETNVAYTGNSVVRSTDPSSKKTWLYARFSVVKALM